MEHALTSSSMRNELDIWLVDDDRIARMIILKTLDQCPEIGQVQSFSDGMEALQALCQQWEAQQPFPDLILLDLNMPVLNGWDFIEAFRRKKNWPGVPIVLLTSSVDPADLNRAKAISSVHGFLSKPLQMNALRQVIGGLR